MSKRTTQRLQDLGDEELLERYQAGEDHALEILIDRYRPELVQFLVRFTSDRTVAEDLFQDTFLQIHLSANTFDPKRRFKPWLFTIAANKARDHLRKQARRPAAPLSAPLNPEEEEGETFADLLEAGIPLPDQQLAEEEVAERVQQTVNRLPDHLREILLLAYFHGFSYNQIAEILAIPLGTVKSRLHTAVGAFGQLWKEENQKAEST